jgi:hypothetical protein
VFSNGAETELKSFKLINSAICDILHALQADSCHGAIMLQAAGPVGLNFKKHKE